MIFISAGHNPVARGARFDWYTEFDLSFGYSIFLTSMLQKSEEEAKFIKPGRLSDKINEINSECNKEDIAIEIHFNSAKNENGGHIGIGSETLYCPGSIKGKLLAECIQGFMAFSNGPNRGVKEGYHKMDKTRKVINYFLRQTKCPAVIVEVDFIHCASVIMNGSYDSVLSIADGINKYRRMDDV